MSPNRDSLNRFLLSRGPEILGASMAHFQIIAGASLLTVAVGLVSVALLRGPGEMAYGAIGPWIAGTINLSTGVSLRRRAAASAPGRVQYSPEARTLLRALTREQGGWGMSFGLCENRAIRYRHVKRYIRDSYGHRLPEPTDEVLDYLERAAKAYQRLAAVTELNRGQPSFSKLGPRVAIAAEEAMASIFHQAAALVRYPEGGAAARKPLEAQIETLEETATRLEQLSSQTPQGLGPNRSSIDDVLTDLRLEVLARSELTPTDAQDPQSHHAN